VDGKGPRERERERIPAAVGGAAVLDADRVVPTPQADQRAGPQGIEPLDRGVDPIHHGVSRSPMGTVVEVAPIGSPAGALVRS